MAAKILGRRSVSVEIEERYCEIAAKRLQGTPMPLFDVDDETEATRQGSLFTPTASC